MFPPAFSLAGRPFFMPRKMTINKVFTLFVGVCLCASPLTGCKSETDDVDKPLMTNAPPPPKRPVKPEVSPSGGGGGPAPMGAPKPGGGPKPGEKPPVKEGTKAPGDGDKAAGGSPKKDDKTPGDAPPKK